MTTSITVKVPDPADWDVVCEIYSSPESQAPIESHKVGAGGHKAVTIHSGQIFSCYERKLAPAPDPVPAVPSVPDPVFVPAVDPVPAAVFPPLPATPVVPSPATAVHSPAVQATPAVKPATLATPPKKG